MRAPGVYGGKEGVEGGGGDVPSLLVAWRYIDLKRWYIFLCGVGSLCLLRAFVMAVGVEPMHESFVRR